MPWQYTRVFVLHHSPMMEEWERQQVFIFKQWRQQNGRLSFSIAVEKSKTIILVIDTKLRKNTKIVNSYYSLASRSPTTPIDPILEGELKKIKEKNIIVAYAW